MQRKCGVDCINEVEGFPGDADTWNQRWAWLRSAPLPNAVRQFMWRRWHLKLYLGENSDNRGAVLCPLCGGPDSVLHMARQCAAGFSLHDYVGTRWLAWTGSLPDADWWTLEVCESDWRWMVWLACVYYSFYYWRFGIARGDFSVDAPQPFQAHLQQQLRQLLGLIACAPPAEGPRPIGEVTADGVWLEECEDEAGRRFRVLIDFPLD